MRSIARQLEFEYCGYAGMFCLNAAKAIGARAHAIGVASARSTTTTRVTVRGDGAGNHGFVDIQPGDAPELQYLQVLGDLAVQVDQLADEIGSVYLDRDNADLIFREEDREGSPDAAGWLLRFLIEMDELDTSCMWLFAECCRVILLQQLRSSHQGITGRLFAVRGHAHRLPGEARHPRGQRRGDLRAPPGDRARRPVWPDRLGALGPVAPAAGALHGPR